MPSILAVDDSASMRQMVAFTLKGAGYTVIEAADGQQAWDLAQRNPITLDVTGLALVDQVRHDLITRKDAAPQEIVAEWMAKTGSRAGGDRRAHRHSRGQFCGANRQRAPGGPVQPPESGQLPRTAPTRSAPPATGAQPAWAFVTRA